MPVSVEILYSTFPLPQVHSHHKELKSLLVLFREPYLQDKVLISDHRLHYSPSTEHVKSNDIQRLQKTAWQLKTLQEATKPQEQHYFSHHQSSTSVQNERHQTWNIP